MDESLGGEERELDRLCRFLTRPGPRFGLALALYRDPRVARELQAEIRRRVGKSTTIHAVVLGSADADRDLVARMVEAAEGADGVFVDGLDRLLVDNAGRPSPSPAIANLNQRRDALPAQVDARVVLWVSKGSYASFRDHAWDLHEVMLTVAEFDRSQKIAETLQRDREAELPGWMAFVDEAEAVTVEERATNLARVAEQSTDPRTRADAAASAAQAYVAAANFDEGLRSLEAAAVDYEGSGELSAASIQRERKAAALQIIGRTTDAERQARLAIDLARRSGDESLHAKASGRLADVLQARGDLDGALQILQEVVLPTFERLGDVQLGAVTMGKVADILQARGELDRALRIRQHDELPIYERLGDVRRRAVTWGRIAEILHAQGQLDRALEILGEDVLPTFERVGDVHAKAVTMGKIADVLQTRGDFDRALQIRQHEQLPVFERLGDVRSIAATKAQIALLRLQQHDPSSREDATKLLSQAHRAFTRMRTPRVAKTVEEVATEHGLTLTDDEPE